MSCNEVQSELTFGGYYARPDQIISSNITLLVYELSIASFILFLKSFIVLKDYPSPYAFYSIKAV